MYKGIELTSQDDYIFDTRPYDDAINMNKVRFIEKETRIFK